MTSPPSFTPSDLGFRAISDGSRVPEGGAAWEKRVGAEVLTFRCLRSLSDLRPVEELQRAVFVGITDADLFPAGMLVVVSETGGEVLGAFRRGWDTDELIGFAIGWGGYVAGRPRIMSDMLGVRPGLRGSGLGSELKKLQAAIALEAGFVEIVWTVDPLRAANARLNFDKLGAHAARYEIDRYGAGFAPDLYGEMPTDRLHVTWPISTAKVRERLLHPGPHQMKATVDPRPPIVDLHRSMTGPKVRVPIPPDIDSLVREDPAAALAWRLRVRASLMHALEEGYAVDGFERSGEFGDEAALVLTRQSEGAS